MDKIEFEELRKKYDEVIQKYSSEELKRMEDKNKLLDIDINRIGEDIKNIDLRITEMHEEISNINNSPVALEYPEQIQAIIKDKEGQIEANQAFKEQKEKKVHDLQVEKEKNEKTLNEVNNIGNTLITEATEKVTEENNIIKEEINVLESKKDAFGLRRKDKDGKETIQYTKEEQEILGNIDKKISVLKERINNNLKKLDLFVKQIERREKTRNITAKKPKEKTTGEDVAEEKTTGEDTTEGKTTGEDTAEGKTTGEDTAEEKTTSGDTAEGKTTGEDTTEGKTTGEDTTEGKTTGEDTAEEKTTSEDNAGKKKTLENATEVGEGRFEAPLQKKGKKIQQQVDDVEVGEDGSTYIAPKFSRIEIDEATGHIRAIDDSGKPVYKKKFEYRQESNSFVLAEGEKYETTYEERTKFEEKINKIKDLLVEQYGEEDFYKKIENIDSRIFDLLVDFKDEAMLENYIHSIFEKDETMPFMLNYNLKDIYNTDMSLEQIKAVQKFSKVAYKQNREMVDVEKDSLPKRIFGRIKKGIKEVIDRKLLSSGENQTKVKNESKKEEKQDERKVNERDNFVFGMSHDENGNRYETINPNDKNIANNESIKAPSNQTEYEDINIPKEGVDFVTGREPGDD